MINILTRISRPDLYERLLKSIDYEHINLITYDDSKERVPRKPFEWNLFCNILKAQVSEGYFVFADDDDYFRPGALRELSDYLTDDVEGIICQFLRHGQPKPSNGLIAAGIIKENHIGGGCLVLHSRHKNVAHWDNMRKADYRWIRDVADKVQLKYIPLILQLTDNNGRKGK